MFEEGPERTNKRFHLVSLGIKDYHADSVTLWKWSRNRPDIYGKIGNRGFNLLFRWPKKTLWFE